MSKKKNTQPEIITTECKVILVSTNYLVVEKNGTNVWLVMESKYKNLKTGDIIKL